jgi:hypothetical protein
MHSRSDSAVSGLWADGDEQTALIYYRELTELIDAKLRQLEQSGQCQCWNESFSDVTGYSDEEIESMRPSREGTTASFTLPGIGGGDD